MSPSEARQAWLEKAVAELRPYFKVMVQATILDKTRVSIGWPKTGRKSLGECYHSTASSDLHREIFVTPAIDDSENILAVLAHELVHAALPDGEGHGKEFKRCAYGIGLEGKATATVAGPVFKAWSDAYIEREGSYPAGLILASMQKKKKTYLLKAECPTSGYTVRLTAKWVDEYGSPICPCCNEAMEIE